jgi:hypothetical protein
VAGCGATPGSSTGRSNETHRSITDDDARLFRKGGQQSQLCFIGHVLMENRNGLAVDAELTRAAGAPSDWWRSPWPKPCRPARKMASAQVRESLTKPVTL